MEGVRLARLRWRLRGAWLWPTFLLLTAIDAGVGHLLPPAGESQSLASAWLVGLWAMLIGVIALSGVAGALIRRRQPGMPRSVARNYGGTVVVLAVSAVLLAAGLIHRSSILAERHALAVATSRARAWIAEHAPETFRDDLQTIDVYTIQAGSIYRACVFDLSARTYCVVVNAGGRRVVFDGYESNAVLGAGTN